MYEKKIVQPFTSNKPGSCFTLHLKQYIPVCSMRWCLLNEMCPLCASFKSFTLRGCRQSGSNMDVNRPFKPQELCCSETALLLCFRFPAGALPCGACTTAVPWETGHSHGQDPTRLWRVSQDQDGEFPCGLYARTWLWLLRKVLLFIKFYSAYPSALCAATDRVMILTFVFSVDECRNIILQYGVREVTASQVARVLGMMARTHSGLSDGIALQVALKTLHYNGLCNRCLFFVIELLTACSCCSPSRLQAAASGVMAKTKVTALSHTPGM